MNSLGLGAKVVTAGGIHGEVTALMDDAVMLEVAEDVEMKMDRRSIVRVLETAADEDGYDEEYDDDEVEELPESTDVDEEDTAEDTEETSHSEETDNKDTTHRR